MSLTFKKKKRLSFKWARNSELALNPLSVTLKHTIK